MNGLVENAFLLDNWLFSLVFLFTFAFVAFVVQLLRNQPCRSLLCFIQGLAFFKTSKVFCNGLEILF